MKRLTFYVVLFFCATLVVHKLKEQSFELFESDAVVPDEGFELEDEAEHKFDKPDKFLEFHRGIRTSDVESAPTYPTGYKWKALQEAKLVSARKKTSGLRTKSNGVVEWKERGPGNVPGRTRALLNIPGDAANNTWLAGSATGGIWRTTDAGSTWEERSGNFPALPISSFTTDASGSVIYAGTGEYISSMFSAIGNGIFKSTDRGITWTQLSSTNNNADFSIVTRVITDPANANTIIATVVPHLLSPNTKSAIMRSIDGGTSWTKVKEITGDFEQVIATPSNFNVQYASQHGVGVWKSTDAGITWNMSNVGMQVTGRVEIAVSPAHPNRLFAAAEGRSSGTNADLYFSSDAGATWSLVDVKFNNTAIDFFEGQGFYDNTVMCDPFDANKVYFGGVSLFRSTVAGSATTLDFFHIVEDNTQSFLTLQQFSNVLNDNQRLTVGNFHNNITVEVRFGPGRSQMAHRFLVPDGATSGVLAADYGYQNYVSIPCEVWDITNNKQLMVSFRDQNRNGKFDLIPSAFPADDPMANSREYFYINNVDYSSTTPSTSITTSGGHEFRLMYNFFPALAPGATWNESALPSSKLIIKNDPVSKVTATTVTVADGRNSFDHKNASNQTVLSDGVHPDHHCMMALVNQNQTNYRIVVGNDGGIFVSKTSADPGTLEGDWSFKGTGYNTSQFYGADKRPGADQYIGGMQDNGTRMSPSNESASRKTNYSYAIGGDGFETIWHSKDPSLILGSVYNGAISRSANEGSNWNAATSGLGATGGGEFPFVTKIANSKDYPDRVFTAGIQGVYRSLNFGGQWTLTPIANNFVIGGATYLDVEVSRANPDIVWAGSGMTNTINLRYLHVSVNGGKTFTATNNFTTVPLGNITKLASHPTQPNTAYALFSFSNKPKVLRTTDLGNTWEDISGFGANSTSSNQFPDVAVYCLYVRPDNPNIIWVGTEIGIVESQDNGATWALIEDFPNVSVWDMKGQDDQVVIATHGRGIWTAIIGTSQNVARSAEVIAAGTAPDKTLALRIAADQPYDSVQVYINDILMKRLYNVSGTTDHKLTVGAGEAVIKLISFRGTVPSQSNSKRVTQLDLLDKANSYSTYFSSVADLSFSNLSIANLGNNNKQRKSLQTHHSYHLNKTYQVTFKRPVTVSPGFSTFFYSDLAILDSSDPLKIEATKNGLDWIELDKHDASFNADWLQALSSGATGDVSMFKTHQFDLKEKFAPGDVLLFRMKIESNGSAAGWGWALNWVSIQQQPVGTEVQYAPGTFSIFPNPARNAFTVEYQLQGVSDVSVTIIDMYGKSVASKKIGTRNPGKNSEILNIGDQLPGTYIIILDSKEGRQVAKMSLIR